MVSVNFIIAQGQTGDGQFPQSIIVSSSTDTAPHLLKLKATQQDGTEARVNGFNLDTTNAVGAQANSQLLILITDSSLRVIEAKVRTASDQVIELVGGPPLTGTCLISRCAIRISGLGEWGR